MDHIIEKIDTVFKIKKELEKLGIIDFFDSVRHGKSVQVGGYDLNDFIDLAYGEVIEIHDRESNKYPYEATFENGDYTFFLILSEGQKEELEKLINEREAEELTNE